MHQYNGDNDVRVVFKGIEPEDDAKVPAEYHREISLNQALQWLLT